VRLDLGLRAQPSLLDHLKAQWKTDRKATAHSAAPHSLFAGSRFYRKAVIYEKITCFKAATIHFIVSVSLK
jgi:hypothetical protein